MANETRGSRTVEPAARVPPEPLSIGPALVTFIGGAEAGNVGSTDWGTETTGRIHFPLKEPVLLDPTKAKSDDERKFIEHVITKARTNRFYVVTEPGDTGNVPYAQVERAGPQPRTHSNPMRGKAGARLTADDQDSH